jgi:hypothetical protein
MIVWKEEGLFQIFRSVLEKVERQRRDMVVREALQWKLSKIGIS